MSDHLAPPSWYDCDDEDEDEEDDDFDYEEEENDFDDDDGADDGDDKGRPGLQSSCIGDDSSTDKVA